MRKPNRTRLFVLGLSPEITDAELAEFVCHVAPPVSIKPLRLMLTGGTLYTYIEMGTEEATEKLRNVLSESPRLIVRDAWPKIAPRKEIDSSLAAS